MMDFVFKKNTYQVDCPGNLIVYFTMHSPYGILSIKALHTTCFNIKSPK